MPIEMVDHSKMREINLSVILDTLRKHEPISRTDLAKISGLNKATVTSLIRDLQNNGFVNEEQQFSSDKGGRPPIGLGLNPAAGTFIGAEIGVDFISAIVTDFSAKAIWRHNESTIDLSDDQAVIQKTMEILQVAHEHASSTQSQIFGLGMGLPGLVDTASGKLLVAPNLGWTDVPIRNLLLERFDFPIFVDNEANLAALGETYFGAAAGCDQVLYLSSGVGLGGGIVLNGHIMTGATGFSGEIGHMTLVAENGLPCNCGNTGCWETVASQWAVFRRVEDAIQRGQDSSLQEELSRPPNRLTIPRIVQAAQEGDAVAISALEETGRWLGIGLANLINALNPRRVVFGGILSLAHEFLMPVIHITVAERAWRFSHEACDIVVAENGADACVFGGVAAVYRQFLSEPQAWMRRASDALHSVRGPSSAGISRIISEDTVA